ncbi:hypothetical protein EV560_10210 [Bosea sp. BK604]|nr:hypothetical protein EV560_10210 [Bosea sp. BK604]
MVALLYDDAFEAQRAGLLEQFSARAIDIFAQADALDLRLAEHTLEERAALVEPQLAQVVAVEIEQVEGIERRGGRSQLAARAAERLLQGEEIGSALGIEHDSFAIDDRAVDAEQTGSLRHGREAVAPVMAAACDDPDLTAGFGMDGEAIAIPFHLIGPVGPFRRL